MAGQVLSANIQSEQRSFSWMNLYPVLCIKVNWTKHYLRQEIIPWWFCYQMEVLREFYPAVVRANMASDPLICGHLPQWVTWGHPVPGDGNKNASQRHICPLIWSVLMWIWTRFAGTLERLTVRQQRFRLEIRCRPDRMICPPKMCWKLNKMFRFYIFPQQNSSFWNMASAISIDLGGVRIPKFSGTLRANPWWRSA